VYALVSSHDRKGDLGRPVARLAGWAARAGGTVAQGKSEGGSGMNETRPEARRLLADPAAVTVEDRDRPGQVTTGLIAGAHGRRLAALHAGKVARGLARDMTGVLTSCRAGWHGRGPSRSRAQTALRSAARHAGPSRAEAA
jgi:putative resolvase